jgi:hypothetical protein
MAYRMENDEQGYVTMKDVLKVKSEKIYFAPFVKGCSEIHELAEIKNIHFVFLVYLNIFVIPTHVLNAENA